MVWLPDGGPKVRKVKKQLFLRRAIPKEDYKPNLEELVKEGLGRFGLRPIGGRIKGRKV